MIHQHVKAASSANYSCLFIGQHRTGCWWSRTPKAFAAARLRIGPRRSGGRCINASGRSQSGIMLPDGLELDGPLDEEQGNDPAKRRAGVTNVASSKATQRG